MQSRKLHVYKPQMYCHSVPCGVALVYVLTSALPRKRSSRALLSSFFSSLHSPVVLATPRWLAVIDAPHSHDHRPTSSKRSDVGLQHWRHACLSRAAAAALNFINLFLHHCLWSCEFSMSNICTLHRDNLHSLPFAFSQKHVFLR